MLKLCLFTGAVLMTQKGQAYCENNEEQPAAAREQESVEYFPNDYGFASNSWGLYYYQPSRAPDYANTYEGRSPVNRQQPKVNSFRSYFSKNNNGAGNNQPEGRFGINQLGSTLINAALFNNRFTTSGTTLNRPFAGIRNRLPITLNPNYAGPLSAFESCTASTGETGICSPVSICSLFGGRPSGSCVLSGVCCINAVTTCGGTVTLNSTYFQSPITAVSSPSTCALTVRLDTALVEQKKAICQIRLDFISFSIAQPSTTTAACTDTFQVGGAELAINKVPTICGDNNGQHMYLQVPPSDTNPTDLQLMFSFGSTTATRSWNIKIAMLPCGASYLAPSDCLQYFTSSTGKAISFNWKDTAATAPRQLLSQDYNICFRTELVNGQRASKLCLTPCATTTTGASAFWLSGAVGGVSAVGTAGCITNNYLIIVNGIDTTGAAADRFCGGNLGVAAATFPAVTTVCTKIKPFRITYETAGVIGTDTLDQGFCLGFAES